MGMHLQVRRACCYILTPASCLAQGVEIGPLLGKGSFGRLSACSVVSNGPGTDIEALEAHL